LRKYQGEDCQVCRRHQKVALNEGCLRIVNSLMNRPNGGERLLQESGYPQNAGDRICLQHAGYFFKEFGFICGHNVPATRTKLPWRMSG